MMKVFRMIKRKRKREKQKEKTSCSHVLILIQSNILGWIKHTPWGVEADEKKIPKRTQNT